MKKIISNTLLIILLLCATTSFSQNVTINGKANKTNALVRLFVINDLLTNEETKMAETRTSQDGSFTLKTTVNEILLARIAIDLERVDFIISPNSSYQLEITIPEQDENASYFERQTPTLNIIKASDNDLNHQFIMTESVINDFIMDNFNRLYRSRKTYLIDSLDNNIQKNVGDIKSDFIKNYIRYKKAATIMAISGHKKVVYQYFDKQDVIYMQPAYMDLFKEIFVDYYQSRSFEPSAFLDAFYSGYGSFCQYLDEKDAFLSGNPRLAELILILNLRRMYYENPDERKIVLEYMNTLKNNSKYQKHKEITSNVLKQINRHSYNSTAPSFSLKNTKNEVVKLSDFNKKLVLLQFVDKISPMIDYQFTALNELHQQWQDSVQIVTIATNDNFADYQRLFNEKGFDWTLLNLDGDILLLEQYQIKTFPDYVIVKPGSKIGMAPAPSPDQYLEYHIRRIYKYL